MTKWIPGDDLPPQDDPSISKGLGSLYIPGGDDDDVAKNRMPPVFRVSYMGGDEEDCTEEEVYHILFLVTFALYHILFLVTFALIVARVMASTVITYSIFSNIHPNWR